MFTNAVSFSKVDKSVFNTTQHNKIFTFYNPGCWQDAEFIKKLEESKVQRNSNQIILHVNEVNKRGLETKVIANLYQL